VESWFVSYVNKNEDIEDTLNQLSMDFEDLENSLFDIKVRKEITVVLMGDYIENWLQKTLTKITEPDQEEVVVTGQGIPMKDNIKGTSTRR
jgi:hypothetical protein